MRYSIEEWTSRGFAKAWTVHRLRGGRVYWARELGPILSWHDTEASARAEARRRGEADDIAELERREQDWREEGDAEAEYQRDRAGEDKYDFRKEGG